MSFLSVAVVFFSAALVAFTTAITVPAEGVIATGVYTELFIPQLTSVTIDTVNVTGVVAIAQGVPKNNRCWLTIENSHVDHIIVTDTSFPCDVTIRNSTIGALDFNTTAGITFLGRVSGTVTLDHATIRAATSCLQLSDLSSGRILAINSTFYVGAGDLIPAPTSDSCPVGISVGSGTDALISLQQTNVVATSPRVLAAASRHCTVSAVAVRSKLTSSAVMLHRSTLVTRLYDGANDATVWLSNVAKSCVTVYESNIIAEEGGAVLTTERRMLAAVNISGAMSDAVVTVERSTLVVRAKSNTTWAAALAIPATAASEVSVSESELIVESPVHLNNVGFDGLSFHSQFRGSIFAMMRSTVVAATCVKYPFDISTDTGFITFAGSELNCPQVSRSQAWAPDVGFAVYAQCNTRNLSASSFSMSPPTPAPEFAQNAGARVIPLQDDEAAAAAFRAAQQSTAATSAATMAHSATVAGGTALTNPAFYSNGWVFACPADFTPQSISTLATVRGLGHVSATRAAHEQCEVAAKDVPVDGSFAVIPPLPSIPTKNIVDEPATLKDETIGELSITQNKPFIILLNNCTVDLLTLHATPSEVTLQIQNSTIRQLVVPFGARNFRGTLVITGSTLGSVYTDTALSFAVNIGIINMVIADTKFSASWVCVSFKKVLASSMMNFGKVSMYTVGQRDKIQTIGSTSSDFVLDGVGWFSIKQSTFTTYAVGTANDAYGIAVASASKSLISMANNSISVSGPAAVAGVPVSEFTTSCLTSVGDTITVTSRSTSDLLTAKGVSVSTATDASISIHALSASVVADQSAAAAVWGSKWTATAAVVRNATLTAESKGNTARGFSLFWAPLSSVVLDTLSIDAVNTVSVQSGDCLFLPEDQAGSPATVDLRGIKMAGCTHSPLQISGGNTNPTAIDQNCLQLPNGSIVVTVIIAGAAVFPCVNDTARTDPVEVPLRAFDAAEQCFKQHPIAPFADPVPTEVTGEVNIEHKTFAVLRLKELTGTSTLRNVSALRIEIVGAPYGQAAARQTPPVGALTARQNTQRTSTDGASATGLSAALHERSLMQSHAQATTPAHIVMEDCSATSGGVAISGLFVASSLKIRRSTLGTTDESSLGPGLSLQAWGRSTVEVTHTVIASTTVGVNVDYAFASTVRFANVTVTTNGEKATNGILVKALDDATSALSIMKSRISFVGSSSHHPSYTAVAFTAALLSASASTASIVIEENIINAVSRTSISFFDIDTLTGGCVSITRNHLTASCQDGSMATALCTADSAQIGASFGDMSGSARVLFGNNTMQLAARSATAVMAEPQNSDLIVIDNDMVLRSHTDTTLLAISAMERCTVTAVNNIVAAPSRRTYVVYSKTSLTSYVSLFLLNNAFTSSAFGTQVAVMKELGAQVRAGCNNATNEGSTTSIDLDPKLWVAPGNDGTNGNLNTGQCDLTSMCNTALDILPETPAGTPTQCPNLGSVYQALALSPARTFEGGRGSGGSSATPSPSPEQKPYWIIAGCVAAALFVLVVIVVAVKWNAARQRQRAAAIQSLEEARYEATLPLAAPHTYLYGTSENRAAKTV